MSDNIMYLLSIAAGRVDGWKYEPLNGHEHDLYAGAADEIERLHSELKNRDRWEWDCPKCGIHVTSQVVER